MLLRDGRTAHIRPMQPEDRELLVDFYGRVSDESKYYRFFSPMPELSDRDLDRFTQVDHRDRVALILLVAGHMIAVGRYDTIRPGYAEVAFLVEDKHQGRGIGQLLLEHLAQAGRERGVEEFVAEVLPDNQAMIHTFRDAGYQVKSAFEDGVMELVFRIDPTDTAIGVMEQREHRAEYASIERFFSPRSVAIIGASRRQDTIGRALVRHMVLGNFAGRIHVVNPSADSVAGMPAWKTVAEIPGDVDVAIVAVPAEAVQDVVLDCAAKGVHGLVVISSGFAETGEEGRLRQRRLVGLSRSYGLRLIGPNALGVINTDPEVSLNASLSSVMPPRGRAGFFCQSGALGSAILEKVQNRGLGLTTFVSAGNRADVSGNDLLQYWEEDDATEVVLLYLESIGNPRKFSRVARRVSRRKPIVAVRSGRSSQGVPMGHAVRKIAAPAAGGRRDVPAGRDHPGRVAGGDVRRRPAARPPAAAARAPGRDRRQLRRPRPARRRRRQLGRPGGQQAGAARRRRDGRGLRGRARRRDRRPRGRRRRRRSSSRRSTSPARARRSPTCSPRSASSPTSRSCRRSSAPRASPSCCACPTSPARRPAAAPCRRTPPSRPRSARSPTSWSTPSGCACRSRRSPTSSPTTSTRPATSSTRC